MRENPLAAAAELAEALSRENEALRRSDLQRAASLARTKATALARFAGSQASLLDAPRAEMLRAIGNINVLAEENRRLLEHAMHIQERVIAVFSRAAASALRRQTSRYGANGEAKQLSHAAPISLSERV